MSLPAFIDHGVVVSHPTLLHVLWLTSTDLLVYRSPLVRDTDELLEPVNAILNSRQHRILLAEVVKDQDMMFGEANLTLYRFGEV